MSSKADDFDVRYRGMRNGRPRVDGVGEGYANGDYEAPADQGTLRSTVDYDLGYDANGWDTQGFRSPEAAYHPEASHPDGKETGDPRSQATDGLDSQPTGYLGDAGVGTPRRRGNGRAGSHARTNSQQDVQQLGWESDASTRPWIPERPDQPGRGGPAGFGGPGRRGRDRSPVKVKGSWWRHWTVRKALGVLLAGVGVLIVLGAVAVAVAYEETPVPTEAMAATGYVQSVVYSSNGTLIGRFGTTNRQMVPYDQIPPGIINAVLAAEDRHFWTEGGISPTGMMRAAWDDITGSGGSLQGGSTITQQFVRNYYAGIGTQQTLSRKLKEIFVAMKVAKEKSKQWILTNYLNTIYLGEGAYGIQAAAETYFDKPITKLDLAQDAVIAAVIQQPSTYPLPQYRAQLKARWQDVINGMVAMGTLTQQNAATLKFPKQLGDYVPQSFGKDPWDPYIMEMVKNELIQVYDFSQSQINDGGYTIRTSIDDVKMAELYQAVQENEQAMVQGGVALPDDAQVGAVLENPANGAIEALYPGPGYPGSEYVDHDGSKRIMTVRECKILDCQVNMAVYNREQVGSSFKPYILATAVKQGMNVQTSTLDGFDNVCIPPDTEPKAYPAPAVSTVPKLQCAPAEYNWYAVYNDSAAENRGYPPQEAMAASINTAYADLWHYVAGPTGANVANMAQLFGVDTDAACITASCGSKKDNDLVPAMENEAGIALGQASLTVTEQATMLATIDDNGIYHDAHVIDQITRNGVSTLIKITSWPVFSSDPTQNAEEDSQVQYAMSADTAPGGTAPTAALSNGQEVIAKTGTTTDYTSAFFIGAIPTQALAVGMFTDLSAESLPSDLGGNPQGGYGGTWPAAVWHTYAEDMFPSTVEQFQPVVFTGHKWNLVPPWLRKVAKPHKKRGQGPKGVQPPPAPAPTVTATCNPQLVACATPGTPPPFTPPTYTPPTYTPPPFGGGTSGANTRAVNAVAAGAAVGGIFTAVPAACLWVRRRARKRGAKRG